jgi:hypothetical protein
MLVGCELSYQHKGNINKGLSRMCMQPPNNNFQVLFTFNILYFIIQQRSRKHFNLSLLLNCNFNNLMIL